MKIKVSSTALSVQLKEAREEIARKIAAAKVAAVKDAARSTVAEGRANIAAAGFSNRWQSGLRWKFIPGPDPEAVIFHKIGLASVFEHGRTIGGKPLLWLPQREKVGRGQFGFGPRKYRGKLVSVNVRGRAPMLFDPQRRELGPLFVGVRQVNIRKRFDLLRIFARAADKMREFYEQRIKEG